MRPGIFFLVVGPSGAGKDTLIDGAREALAGDPRWVFATRTITRAADAGGERHDAMDDATFAETERDGGFLIAWSAHEVLPIPIVRHGDQVIIQCNPGTVRAHLA